MKAVRSKEATTQQVFLPWPTARAVPGEGWSVVRGAGFTVLAVSVHRDTATGFVTKYFKQVLTVKTAKKKSVLKSIAKKRRSKKV